MRNEATQRALNMASIANIEPTIHRVGLRQETLLDMTKISWKAELLLLISGQVWTHTDVSEVVEIECLRDLGRTARRKVGTQLCSVNHKHAANANLMVH